jgi:hypothetical protein
LGLKKIKNILINEDNYVYPYPELIFQTTREATSLVYLGSGKADNENGYIYFYADSDWKNNSNVYVGESKNDIQSRHNSTHKNSAWFKNITYPLIGIVNSPNLPWDTDTRRAIESKTVYKLHNLGLQIVNGANSTWTNGGTVHPNVNDQYVEDVSDIIVNYIKHHIGYFNDTPITRVAKSILPKPGKAATDTFRTRNNIQTTLLDMIKAEIIISGANIVSTERNYPGEASILEGGKILFNGSIYETLSKAGYECRRLVKKEISGPNGWTFWGIVQNDGSIKSLSEYREEYQHLHND